MAPDAVMAGVPPERAHLGTASWILLLALPALAVGVLLYPDIHLATMGTAPAALLAVLLTGAVLVTDHPKLIILAALGVGFLPSSAGGFAAVALCLLVVLTFFGLRRFVSPLAGADVPLMAVLAWATLAWLVNLGRQTDLWSYPVSLIMLWAPWILVFVLRTAGWKIEELRLVLRVWLALILVQLVPALVKPLVVHQAGAYLVPLLPLELAGFTLPGHGAIAAAADITSGTMLSAHHLGAVAIIGGGYLVALYWRTRRKSVLVAAAAMGFAVLMADAKHVVLAALVAGTLAFALLLWPELARRTRAWVFALGLTVMLGGGLIVGRAVAEIVSAGLLRPLVALASSNPKVQLYLRTSALLKANEAHTWIGFGPGSFASRAASSRATSALFKEKARLPEFIPPFTSPAYGKVVYDLYTADIVATIQYRSDVLTSPFSSAVGVVGELGIVGSLLFAWFLGAVIASGLRCWRDVNRPAELRAAGGALVLAVALLAVLAFFDSYFEQPDIVLPAAVLWLLCAAPVSFNPQLAE